jgi:hypothetical protein
MFCDPAPEEPEEEGTGMMGEEEQAPEEEEGQADDQQDGEGEMEAEPAVIETTGMPFAGSDLNGNGIDDFEEFEQDCSCLTVSGIPVYTE